jgi:hypothetical protein
MNFLLTMWSAYKAYRYAREFGSGCVILTLYGVPQVACFLAIGREAWKVSQLATQEFELNK